MKTSNSDLRNSEINSRIKSLKKSFSQLKKRKRLTLTELQGFKKECDWWHERINLSGKYPVKHAFTPLEEIAFDYYCKKKAVISRIVENMILQNGYSIPAVKEFFENYFVDLHDLIVAKRRLKESNMQFGIELSILQDKYKNLQNAHIELQREIIQVRREMIYGKLSRLSIVR
ncbi:MAG TPA: hypothetical protein VK213_13565 [Bacteroidales bacterium]|nr:hypothetical protein [Bacteroidales bacterium]